MAYASLNEIERMRSRCAVAGAAAWMLYGDSPSVVQAAAAQGALTVFQNRWNALVIQIGQATRDWQTPPQIEALTADGVWGAKSAAAVFFALASIPATTADKTLIDNASVRDAWLASLNTGSVTTMRSKASTALGKLYLVSSQAAGPLAELYGYAHGIFAAVRNATSKSDVMARVNALLDAMYITTGQTGQPTANTTATVIGSGGSTTTLTASEAQKLLQDKLAAGRVTVSSGGTSMPDPATIRAATQTPSAETPIVPTADALNVMNTPVNHYPSTTTSSGPNLAIIIPAAAGGVLLLVLLVKLAKRK